jgi:serine/threonine-protein kinase RsbW
MSSSIPLVSHIEFNAQELRLRLRFAFAADVLQIGPVIDNVMSVVRAIKCACGKEDDVEICLHEALANAVQHGAKNDVAKKIECCVACDPESGMLILVRDPGEGFDAAKLPATMRGERLHWEHGRGIFLINQLMDQVEYRQGGTEIRMRKLPCSAKPNCGLG